MATRRRQSTTSHPATLALAQQLVAAKAQMVRSLVRMGCPLLDAQDAVGDVVDHIVHDRSAYAEKLADLDRHRCWFAALALEAYVARLEAEWGRRQSTVQSAVITTSR